MAIQILTAEQRQASKKTSLAIFGPYGVGKTSLLKHLPAEHTLFLDIEAGMKSVEPWPGAVFPVRAFSDFQDFVALVAGPKPDAGPLQWYSAQHYEHVSTNYRGTIVEEYAAKPVIFTDSISKLTRLAMTFAQQQPEAVSEKTGRPDIRGAYGLLAREVIGALEHLQHAPGKTIIFVGLLEKIEGEWTPMMEGSKVGRELPGIVDQVVSMHTFSRDMSGNLMLDDKAEERRFVCKRGNPFGLPAKDRSGRLDMTEPPDLGALLMKINGKG
jgi:hypothetical protein